MYEPAIGISDSERIATNADRANYATPTSARDLLARDIRIRWNNTDAPNSALQDLIQLNEELHRSDFLPLHRTSP